MCVSQDPTIGLSYSVRGVGMELVPGLCIMAVHELLKRSILRAWSMSMPAMRAVKVRMTEDVGN